MRNKIAYVVKGGTNKLEFMSAYCDTDKCITVVIYRDSKTHEMLKSVYECTNLTSHGNSKCAKSTPKLKFIDNYINDNFDVKLLTESTKLLFVDFIYSKINDKKLSTNGTSFESKLVEGIMENNNQMFENEFNEFVYDLYCSTDISEVLDKQKNLLNIKFFLLQENQFSGKYKVRKDKYTDNDKNKTFDIITVELGMQSSYEENLTFLKSNMKDVRALLKNIIEVNKSSRKYSNYLKLFSLILNKENVLVAKFCFKDGLESKLN